MPTARKAKQVKMVAKNLCSRVSCRALKALSVLQQCKYQCSVGRRSSNPEMTRTPELIFQRPQRLLQYSCTLSQPQPVELLLAVETKTLSMLIGDSHERRDCISNGDQRLILNKYETQHQQDFEDIEDDDEDDHPQTKLDFTVRGSYLGKAKGNLARI